MYKLVTDIGRWATNDNGMIFGKTVYLSEEKDAYRYHLIDDDGQEIKLSEPISNYLKEN